LFSEEAMNESSEQPTVSRPSRRSVMKGAAALAAIAAAGGPAVQVFAATRKPDDGHGGPRANVLLAHGVWVDGSSWSRVIPILQQQGHTVIALQLNLQSLADDVAWTQHVLAERVPPGPTVLAGHSYGGAVISGAGTGAPAGRVIGLVFASAFAPDAGETLGGLGAMFPQSPALTHLQPDSEGFLWFDPAAFAANLAQDLPAAVANVTGAAQRPGFEGLFTDVAGTPAWRTVPSWTLISTLDLAINPALQRFMAKRAHAKTIEVASSHASILSHPQEVAGLIMAAAGDFHQ
jgi:pimeloyl-ACP methyl ester carboxylesterase